MEFDGTLERLRQANAENERLRMLIANEGDGLETASAREAIRSEMITQLASMITQLASKVELLQNALDTERAERKGVIDDALTDIRRLTGVIEGLRKENAELHKQCAGGYTKMVLTERRADAADKIEG